jgi:acetyltransferase-like isoleucine patch superfamily enzyme
MAESHGTGRFSRDQFASLGENVVFEEGVLVFHPERIQIGSDVYVGHFAILKGYYNSRMVIGEGAWIGQQCFLHSAGGLTIERHVGVGPGVKILTSSHRLERGDRPILHNEIAFAPVHIGEGADLGAGAIVLPGVRIGKGAQVGAGAVVADDVADYAIVAGVPAKFIRIRV